VLASIAISTTKERRAMADGVHRREEVLPPVASPTGVVSLIPLARNVGLSNKPSFESGCLHVGEDESEMAGVCARGHSEDADQLKKIAEKKLQLITPNPPKYRYSMEEDTELTMEDKEKMNQEEEEYAEYSQTIELSYRVRFEQRSKCLFNLLHIHADSLPCTISC
jgi:hypothetical protein